MAAGTEFAGREMAAAAAVSTVLSVLAVSTIDASVDGFVRDEALLAIDVDALVAARDIAKVERQLEEIVSTLAGCHLMTSLPLTPDQRERYSLCSFWVDIFSAEIGNVRTCALERKTQLLVRNKKLVLMDTELCRSFGKDCYDDLREQSLDCLFCVMSLSGYQDH